MVPRTLVKPRCHKCRRKKIKVCSHKKKQSDKIYIVEPTGRGAGREEHLTQSLIS